VAFWWGSIGLFARDTTLFVIGTGKRHGNYYKAGAYIAAVYNRTFPNAHFVFIETDGSNENIRMLRNRALDFGLVQRDVLINSIYDREKGVKNLAVVVPLFQEALQVYFKGLKARPLSQIDRLKDGDQWTVGFTSRDGYSYQVFQTVMRFLNVDLSKMAVFIGNYAELKDALQVGKVDAVVSFSLPVEALEKIPGIRKMYLTENAARLLQNRLPGLFVIREHPGRYNVGTWSFLVVNKKSLERLPNPDLLVDALVDTIQHDTFSRIIAASLQQFVANRQGEMRNLRKISIVPALQRRLPAAGFAWAAWLVPLSLLILVTVVWRFFQRKLTIDAGENLLYFYWQRYKHFVFGLVALVLIFFASVELLLYYEMQFSTDTGKMSPILNLTRSDLYSWVIITTITSNSQGIFPYSMAGKVMLALNSLNFWVGTILIGTAELVAIRINKKRKQGRMESKFKNHVVIFGWNSTAEKLIIDLRKDARQYVQRDLPIVVVTHDTQTVRSKYARVRYLHDVKHLDLIAGDAMDFHVLEMANTHQADTVILLADDNTPHADERTVMRALAISRYTKRKKNEKKSYRSQVAEQITQKARNILRFRTADRRVFKRYDIRDDADSIYMIAEINDPQFYDSLIDAEVNEIMVSGNYRRAIIKQSVFNHGISRVIDEIVNFNEYNEFYKIDLSLDRFAKLRGKTFDELLVALRKVGILLVGIHVIFHDSHGNVIIDRQVIRQLLDEEENGLPRDIIVNPIDPRERQRPVDEDDHLIVLARNFEEVETGIQKLSF